MAGSIARLNPSSPLSFQQAIGAANMRPTGQRGTPAAHSPVGTSLLGAAGQGGSVPRLGPTRKAAAGAFVQDRWLGLNQAVAPERLSPLESPDLVNMNTWARLGSLSTRMCRGKCAEAATRGTGVCVLPTSFIDASGARNVLMVSFSGSAQTLELSRLTLPAKPERGLDFVPDVTLTSPSAGNIRVAISALPTVGGIEAVLSCWSTVGYPTSPWSVDTRRNTAGREETAWFGVDSYSTDTDVTGEVSATSTVYVSVWLISRLGMSQPYHGTVSVTIS